MAYQIFARKYRPQVFDDVIGQDVIVRTLKNSIKEDRIANAYIFTGPRGVGKTTVARLIAKALNCEKPQKGEPCDKCDSCREITSGNNIDVLEIDGASNNGVDEVRVLRENVKFSPSKGKFKIYIIDEVHMLSAGAFNALLKTLEEPPVHVKFIFATTEAHKVLPTIMSRCQRFDFRRIPPAGIIKRIMDIAKKESIEIDDKAAMAIARSSDGSLRDALVVLDQMIAFSGKKISSDDVTELLGMVKKENISRLADALAERDPASAVRILDGMISGGKDPIFIAGNLIEHYRDIMIIKTSGPTSDMTFTGEEIEDIKKKCGNISVEEILYILQNLTHCVTLMKGTMLTRAPLEIALIRLARRADVLALDEILDRLEKIDIRTDSVRAVYHEPAEDVSVNAYIEEGSKPAEEDKLEKVDDEIVRNEEPSGFQPIQAYWKLILSHIKEKKMSVFTFLSVAKPVELNKEKMVIGFSSDHVFNKEAMEIGDNKVTIEEAVRKVTSAPTRVEFSILEFLGENSKQEKEEIVKRRADDRKSMKPVIEKAMDVFGGHVVRDLTEEK
ncbi:MAG: DNA polymerase III subunit gamma/tau [Candidatus Omnitrophica bacterium]|nr:DNA polymerase III subunit gamma/tau [Candidatus Omnitrophota bacterium]